MRESVLSLENLTLGYGGKTVVRDISFEVERGSVVTLLGANGEGKTTIIRAVCQLKIPRRGRVCADGKDLSQLKHGERASLVSYVPQSHKPGLPLSVRDMVVLGRQYCRGLFAEPSREDYDRADRVLERLTLGGRGGELFTSLSGGEQRLVLIARALVQSARYMVLDEPVANLDMGNQIRVLRVIEELAREGTGILMSSHFPQHSLWLRSRAVILHRGGILARGEAEDVITGENLTRIYGTPIAVVRDGEGTAYCGPRPEEPERNTLKEMII